MPQRIAIVRALPGLGDLLCAVPAWRTLRTALPEARIALIGMPWAKGFVERFSHYFDDFIPFPGFPGLLEQNPPIRELPEFFASVHQRHFDLALQMHGSGTVSNPLTVLLGARINAGFFLPNQYCPDEERFLPYPDSISEVWRHLRLMEFLGIPLQGDYLEFPLQENDWQALHAIDIAGTLQPGEYVCVHPGASVFERRWPPERFAAVADALARRGLQVVLTGVAQEVDLAEGVASMMPARPLNLAGRTSLGAVAALLSGARLLICNDTGVSHLAAALSVPSVVIFNDLDVEGWAPLNRQRHRVVCHPEGVSMEAVLAEVEDLLRQEAIYAA
ncbi:MAG: glycosyltransferase family 9 protein [Chloroflexota bacterium]|nr:glycosyltransferase family 9 protein [Chloroflexota bacterium]